MKFNIIFVVVINKISFNYSLSLTLSLSHYFNFVPKQAQCFVVNIIFMVLFLFFSSVYKFSEISMESFFPSSGLFPFCTK